MSLKNGTNSINPPQILNFSVEKQSAQLSINIDDKEIELLYVNYYPMVYRRCLSILHNEEDAKDMSHEVFAKIQELKTDGRFHTSFPKTYLSTAAKNMSFNQKKRARRELIEIYNIATNESLDRFKDREEKGRKIWEAGIIDNGYEQVEAEIIVKAILEEQDEITRKIYFYKYHDNMTLEQIGEAVGLGKSAVQIRIDKYKEQFKVKLGRAVK